MAQNYAKPLQYTDFDTYLEKLKQKNRVDFGESAKPVSASPKEYLLQKLRSDEKAMFIATTGGVVHDKTCKKLDTYPVENLIALDKYPKKKYSPCPECAVKAYLRNGTTDFKKIDAYQKFIEHTHASTRDLKKLYVTHEAKTNIIHEGIYVRVRHDSWKILLQKDGKVRLMHNNYIAHNDGTRTMSGEFHIQADNITIKRAVQQICSYQYERHTMTENVAEILPEKTVTEVVTKLNIFKEIIFRIRKFLVHLTLKGKYVITVDGMIPMVDRKPEDGTYCSFVANFEGQKYWYVGTYIEKNKVFCAYIGQKAIYVNATKVLAWKEYGQSSRAYYC